MRIAFEESDLESSGVEERQLSKRKRYFASHLKLSYILL